MKEIINLVVGTAKSIMLMVVGFFALFGVLMLIVFVGNSDDTVKFFTKIINEC